MTMVLWIVGSIILLIIGFLVYRWFAFRREGTAHWALQFRRVEPLLTKLESGIPLRAEDVAPFALDNKTRCTTYQLLEAQKLLDLFPNELTAYEKAAEGRLVNWLEFPTELGTAPDAIEHIEKVTFVFDGKEMHYHVYKFKMNDPHPLAKAGWELGVVGPYLNDSRPYDEVGGTFSRGGRKFGDVDPKDEARWVHENIVLKRGFRP